MKNKLALLLICVALTGCGAASSTTPVSDSSSSTVSEESSSSSSIFSEEIAEGSSADVVDTANYTQPKVAVADKKVIFENDQVTIQAESLDSDADSTYVEVTIENHLDKNITLSCAEAYVNNYLIETAFNTEIAAGDSLMTGIDFSNADLNACGITEVTDIDLRLSAYDFQENDLLYETDLMQVTTDRSGSYEQTVDASGDTVFTNNGVTVIQKGIAHDTDGSPERVYLVTNTSDKAIYLDAELTGKSADSAYLSCGYTIAAGKQALIYLQVIDTDGRVMTSIDGLTYHFLLSDGETWEDIATSDELTF